MADIRRQLRSWPTRAQVETPFSCAPGSVVAPGLSVVALSKGVSRPTPQTRPAVCTSSAHGSAVSCIHPVSMGDGGVRRRFLGRGEGRRHIAPQPGPIRPHRRSHRSRVHVALGARSSPDHVLPARPRSEGALPPLRSFAVGFGCNLQQKGPQGCRCHFLRPAKNGNWATTAGVAHPLPQGRGQGEHGRYRRVWRGGRAAPGG